MSLSSLADDEMSVALQILSEKERTHHRAIQNHMTIDYEEYTENADVKLRGRSTQLTRDRRGLR